MKATAVLQLYSFFLLPILSLQHPGGEEVLLEQAGTFNVYGFLNHENRLGFFCLFICLFVVVVLDLCLLLATRSNRRGLAV